MAIAGEKITTCLWFDTQGEEAAKFYTSVFKNGRINKTVHYGKEGFEVHGRPEGSVMTVEFEIEGRTFLALNGGPHFKFDEAVSLIVHCDSQEEIDRYWNTLSKDGGSEGPCGWLKDKFGLSWQITPAIMGELMDDANPAASGRAMAAMLTMKKIDIAALKKAHAG